MTTTKRTLTPGKVVEAEKRARHYETTRTRDFDMREWDELPEVRPDEELFKNAPLLLKAPAPRPGYVNYFMRYRLGHEQESRNTMLAAENGWRPQKDKDGNPIIVMDCVLMERPIAIQRQWEQKLKRESERQIQAVVDSEFRDLPKGQGFKPGVVEEHIQTTEHVPLFRPDMPSG